MEVTKKTYKIWTWERKLRKAVSASGFEELKQKALSKLGLESGVITLEDGTEIDDDDSLGLVSEEPLIFWKPESFQQYTDDNATCGLSGSSTSSSLLSDASSETVLLEPAGPSRADQREINLRANSLEWAQHFLIPYQKFPRTYQDAVKEGKRPIPSDKVQVAKIVVGEIIHSNGPANRQVFRIIANKLIASSPKSFQTEIGSGAESFRKMLENAYYNHPAKRQNNRNSLKRSLHENETEPLKFGYVKDTYGCIEWQPSQYPEGEDEETQNEKKKWLQKEFKKKEKDSKKVDDFMVSTYASQRFDINKKLLMMEVRENWPFLFKTKYFIKHFEKLTGVSFETLKVNFSEKMPPVVRFLKTKSERKIEKWVRLSESAEREGQDEECANAAGLLMVASYFDEDNSHLLKEVEETCDFEKDVFEDCRYPCLIYKGTNPLTSRNVAVVIETTAFIHTQNLLEGLLLWFISFFVCNICYPERATCTLEWMQRLFANINPQRGSKAKKRGQAGRIEKLVEKVKDFEWDL